MKYSASSLSFPQGSIRGLKNLDKREGDSYMNINSLLGSR